MEEGIKRERRIFYGWFIVAVSFISWFVADAFGMYTFGLFLGPISRELGWTVVMITGAHTLRSVIGGLSGPVVGALADTKHGARVLMSCGVLVAGTVPIAVSRVNALWQFYLLYGVIGALGMVGFGGLVTNTIIAKWFIRMRGRAMGIAAMGVSTSGIVFVPLVTYLISNLGWRKTLMVLGILIWSVALIPVILIMRRRPEDMGLRPDGNDLQAFHVEDEEFDQAGAISSGERIWTLREALRTKALWLVLMAFTTTGISMSGAMIHFFPFLEARGFSSNLAASVITTFAFACAVVKVPWGLIAEKIHARYCCMASFAGSAVSLAIFLNSESVTFAFLYAVVYGIALGGIMVLRELIWANYFGRTFLGTIRGVVMPANLISMAGGPLLAAWLKDITGSYQYPFLFFMITYILGTFFMYLGKPPKVPVNTFQTEHVKNPRP